jgi:cytidine deaminase
MKMSEGEFNALLTRAMQIRENAYAPYSKYAVGAALMSASGDVFTGANVENAAYSMTMCAERSAIFNAVSSGVREIKAIVVVTEDGGVSCGACRQAISEFGKDVDLIFVNAHGEIILQTTISELLPHAFGKDSLTSP